MVRPYDRSYGFEGRFYARPEHAPVSWVGDNRRDDIGLADALDHVFRSARAGYAVVGSDIGGYLDRDDLDLTGDEIPADTLVFARWTALGALNPFMQLHGRANLTPWTVIDHVDETVALYRYWSTLHDDLVPFWYSTSRIAEAGGPNVMRPLGTEATWDGDYRYLLVERDAQALAKASDHDLFQRFLRRRRLGPRTGGRRTRNHTKDCLHRRTKRTAIAI
jgi:alpha-D-xyloside xylohydrolase